MIFAIGFPGEAVRQYLETEDADRAGAICDEGEIALLVDDKLPWATIAQDGLSVVIGQAPSNWHLDGIRIRRTALLARCDWTALPDSPISDAKKEEWRLYRQALREMPGLQPDATLESAVWPIEPEA